MIRTMADKTIPCEDCLDWRAEQSRDVGAHIASVIRLVLRDLDQDPDDPHVSEVCARRLREVTVGTHDNEPGA
jgi:hypothetical protein